MQAGKVKLYSQHLAHRILGSLRSDAHAMGKVSSMKSDLAQINAIAMPCEARGGSGPRK